LVFCGLVGLLVQEEGAWEFEVGGERFRS